MDQATPPEVPQPDTQNIQSFQKSPILAAVLSFFISGAGQVYNGHYGKGIVICLTGWLIIPWIYGIIDAYIVANKINSGELVGKNTTGCLVAFLTIPFFVFFIALFAAIAIPNLLRAKISANDALAQGTLRALSTAAETYKSSVGDYPYSIYELTEASPPFINSNPCGQIVSGYMYECNFSSDGYTITAVPDSPGASGSGTISIRTGGKIMKKGYDPNYSDNPSPEAGELIY